MARLLNAASAAALSLAMLAATPVLAQDQQTTDAVMTELAELGVDTEGMTLTEDQVLQIQALLGDASLDDTQKVSQIEAMLAE